MTYKFEIFDFDGTIVDTGPGITNAVGHALERLGLGRNTLEFRKRFVGPPLTGAFEEYCGIDHDSAVRAVEYFREYYVDRGIHEAEPYEGIPDAVRSLSESGRILSVASSKPMVFVEQLLERFGIRDCFSVVLGSGLDGSLTDKSEAVKLVVSKLGASSHDCVMVGDRRFDIIGAKTNGLFSVGVSYGYGSYEELEEAGADRIVNSVEELREFLLQ